MIVYGDKEKYYLDYSPLDDEGAYIDIVRVMVVVPVSGIYFEREKSLRLVWNYVLDIGVKNTFLKVLSRTAEKARNEKYLLIGIGSLQGNNTNDDSVLFVAPKHPAYISRVWLPGFLFHRVNGIPDRETLSVINNEEVSVEHLEKFQTISGWDLFSGEPQPEIDWCLVQELLNKGQLKCCYRKAKEPIVTKTTLTYGNTTGTHSATLFGFGNYAKTIIIPSLPKEIVVNRIHEIDPLQISTDRNYIWDTSPELSNEDSNEIVFIAGYHHTHNDLACAALEAGISTVVEKPLVTNRRQMGDLEKAFKLSKGGYFACFHRRYSLFNALAKQDLGVKSAGDAINYHCIVYEVPLPEKHWYRWKNSSTRIISNGCHWIDHFLYLNDFAEPVCIRCSEASDGTVSVLLELTNSACFTMTLTDIGSEKIGMQDHIELRRGQITVKIVNGTSYQAEGKDRTLRTKTINKISSYRHMYSEIGKAILAESSGDTWQSIRISSETILTANELIENQRK